MLTSGLDDFPLAHNVDKVWFNVIEQPLVVRDEDDRVVVTLVGVHPSGNL